MCVHQHSQLRIIHKDLKTNNIMLDKNLNPKISDCGLAKKGAKICKEDDIRAQTNQVMLRFPAISTQI